MRALTLTQPWAGLVASGIKLVENRRTNVIGKGHIGQLFAIHASREIDWPTYGRIAEIAPDVLRMDGPLPIVPCKRDWYPLSRITSAVIGVARLVHSLAGWTEESITTHKAALFTQLEHWTGDGRQVRWFFGPVGYVLRDVVALAEPVPCRGALGFWTLPDDAERHVVAQLGSADTHVHEAVSP